MLKNAYHVTGGQERCTLETLNLRKEHQSVIGSLLYITETLFFNKYCDNIVSIIY